MNRSFVGRAAVATLVSAGVVGCGVLDGLPSDGPGHPRTPQGEFIAPVAAYEAVTLGQSTTQDVTHALGPALVVRFDSGYQVWAYRWMGTARDTQQATEVILLFNPSGVATKKRLRRGDPSSCDARCGSLTTS